MTLNDSWWNTPDWRAYEDLCTVPIRRVDELKTAQWSTQVVDLTRDEATLWRDLRGSYKPLIHRAERTYDLCVTVGLPAGAIMDECRHVHFVDAGRITRPVASWHLMADWVDEGSGLLVTAIEPLRLVGYAYFLLYGHWAYYASAATLERNVNHALIWHAMSALKSRGITELELGWQGYAPPTDAKGIGIEFFRRGFGGKTIPIQGYYRIGAESIA